MIHRALLGSLERFFGILVEHYAGSFPAWLAPEQVRVLPLSEKFKEYGEEILKELKAAGMRAKLDSSDEKLGYKIRQAELQKIPYALVVGKREAAQGTVGVRKHREGDLGSMKREEFIARLEEDLRERR